MPEIPYKQVIVVNRALKMSIGKTAAQASHASMMFLVSEDPAESQFSKEAMDLDFELWMNSSMATTVLRVDSAEALDRLEETARSNGLHVRAVIDAGRTQFDGVSTKTCICIGPNLEESIDVVTGELPLL